MINLLSTIARMNYDGEILDDGTEFDMVSDDAVETINSLIREARAELAVPTTALLLSELNDLESIACEAIQDAQGAAEEAMGLEIVDWDGSVNPEDAAPELDDARGLIRDALDILNALEKNA
jgi:hypothetical protein